MGWRFHRVFNIIPGFVRLNVSKSGVSTSVGPRGADVNIGPHGATANAGIAGTGLSYRQKLGYHGSGIGVGFLIAMLAVAGWKYFGHSPSEMTAATPSSTIAAPTQTASDDSATSQDDDSGNIPTVIQEPRTSHRAAKSDAGADVIAAAKPASGMMYVHRNNSDLRAVPSSSAPAIKKLAKGEQVAMIALSDKWAEVSDNGTKGWMRSSILKNTPPGESKRKKKSDSDN